MLAGQRRCKLQLMRKDSTVGSADEYGDREDANPLVPVACMWGSLKPISGRENYADNQREPVTRYVFETGWFEGRQADASMVFVYGTRRFDIVTVLPDEDTRKSVRFYLDEKLTGA